VYVVYVSVGVGVCHVRVYLLIMKWDSGLPSFGHAMQRNEKAFVCLKRKHL